MTLRDGQLGDEWASGTVCSLPLKQCQFLGALVRVTQILASAYHAPAPPLPPLERQKDESCKKGKYVSRVFVCLSIPLLRAPRFKSPSSDDNEWLIQTPWGFHHQRPLLFCHQSPSLHCLEFPISLLTAHYEHISTVLSDDGHLGHNNKWFHNSRNSSYEKTGFDVSVFVSFSAFSPHPSRTQAGDSVWFLEDGVAGKLFQYRHDH